MENEKKVQCVGFIMDGNRRWAKERGLPTLEGHARGYNALKQMIDAVYKAHIPHMVCYAFSTENWGRSEEEVSYLMRLFAQGIHELRTDFVGRKEKINIHIIGERTRFPEDLRAEIEEIEKKHHSDPELTVWVALSYGGRAEIVQAVNRAIEKGEQVTEESFGGLLWTVGMPDPDIIIRTSGEERISNFLLWQSAYSELFFVDTYWPDFGESDFQSILEQYEKRKRRKGR
jgi:undecaprenyl diphosphate synthase